MDLPWILLFISILLIAIIAWHGARFSMLKSLKNLFAKKQKHDDFLNDYHEEIQDDLFEVTEVREVKPAREPAPNQIFCINLKAPEGKFFAGEQLVVHLNRAGMRFGKFDIFHYDELFSVASAYEPGTFDLNRLESLKTGALTFFMETAHLDDVMEAFETMLDTAQHLADQLRAEVCDDKWQPLTDAVLDRYYDRIDLING